MLREKVNFLNAVLFFVFPTVNFSRTEITKKLIAVNLVRIQRYKK